MIFENITRRLDGSYVIGRNGMPYHVPNDGEYAALWAEVRAFALAYPQEVTEEQPLPPPPPPTLEQAIAAKLAEVMAGYSAVFAEVEKIYPRHEREGWHIQEAEAVAYMTDPNAPTPVLSWLCQLRNRGETVPELVAKVMQNAADWRGYYAWYTGQQQRMYNEVMSLGTVAAVQAYVVAYAPIPE